MSKIEFDKFVVKIMDICKILGYNAKSKKENTTNLEKYVTVE
jgi:hypothetical protein